MALVAETLVEEWLNRKGYFTIRGIKTGSGEIDLLAVSSREPDALHVEVTVSTNPIGYIGRDAQGTVTLASDFSTKYTKGGYRSSFQGGDMRTNAATLASIACPAA